MPEWGMQFGIPKHVLGVYLCLIHIEKVFKMTVQNHAGKCLTVILLFALGMGACVARPDQKEVDYPAPPSPPSTTSPQQSYGIASPPVTLDMELQAAPGASTGTLNISFNFWINVTDARVVFYQPREMALVYSKATDRRAGDSLVVWQGNSEARQVREFSYTVPVSADHILQTAVYVSFKRAGIEGRFANHWDQKAIYYLDTGSDILQAKSAGLIRQKQLKHEIQEKGYAELDKYEIKERDRDLFWDLEYPFEKPQPDTVTVIAPDGTPLQQINLYSYHLDTIPNHRRHEYGNRRRTIERYMQEKQSGRKLVLPPGFHYSDLPDSVAVFHDNPLWNAEERGAAYDAYTLRIQEWIRENWSPSQLENK